MLWQAIVVFVSLGIAFVVIRRFAIRVADERAERERQRNVEEAIKAKKLSDVAKRLRLTYALDEKPPVGKPPMSLIARPNPNPNPNEISSWRIKKCSLSSDLDFDSLSRLAARGSPILFLGHFFQKALARR